MTLRESLLALPDEAFSGFGVTIRPIRDDRDLWYAAAECRLAPGQEDLVSPAGFSIGRAWLDPEDHFPCVICRESGERIGYIVLRRWALDDSSSWSYYLDRDAQGQGLGAAAARLAVRILRTAMPDRPVKLSVEADNEKAQRLYQRLGFRKTGELDGNDLIFEL